MLSKAVFYRAVNALVLKFGGCFDRLGRELVFPLGVNVEGEVVSYRVPYAELATAADLVTAYADLVRLNVREQA